MTTERRPRRARHAFDVAALLAVALALGLAGRALSEPWARGRVLAVFEIARGPGAALVVSLAIVALGTAVQAIAASRAGRLATGIVHTSLGLAMGAVGASALEEIARARGGFFVGTIASLGTGPGLHGWLAAAVLLTAFGALQIAWWWRAARQRRVARGRDGGFLP